MAANAQLIIDMGAIRCDQYLAMPPAQSRDFSAWMSGWFSYQTRRTFGCRFAPDKHRELESVVPIPSARRRDGCVAEGDWPAVKCWRNGGITMRRNVLFIAAILLVAGSLPSAAQFRVDMNNMTCGNRLDTVRRTGKWLILDQRLLQCRLQQQHPELPPPAKKFCKGCGVLQEPKSQSLDRDQEHGLWD